MAGNSLFFLLFSLFCVSCVLSAGCSDEAPAQDTAAATPSHPAAKYSEGDIVATASSSGSPSLYLIMKYDPATDQYTRAVIEKNADGTWGHRSSAWTEKIPRATLEKLFTVRAGHVAVSIVPVVTHTALPQATAGQSAKAPVISKISPSTASKDSTVTMAISGENFQNGAAVRIYQAGSVTRNATVMSVTAFDISCVFDLTGLNNGNYNIIVINPDGQSDSRGSSFSISDAAPVIASLYPVTGSVNARVPVTISGQNFRNEVKVAFTNNNTEMTCDSPLTMGSEKISCTLDLSPSRGAAVGEWQVTVLNIRDGRKGTWAKKFTVTAAPNDT